jgi:uncharacterized membrane protein
MSLLDRLIKLCEQQKHDPRLMPVLCWWLTIFFGIDAYHHLRDTSWEFWKPVGWFVMAFMLAIKTTLDELRWVKKQKTELLQG